MFSLRGKGLRALPRKGLRVLTAPGRGFRSAVRWLELMMQGPVLTPEECERYEREGYLIFDPKLPDRLLERVKADVESKYLRVPPGTPGYPLHHRVQDGWKFSSAVKRLALAPRVLGALRQLYGRQPLPFQTLNFPVGTEQKVHSDTIHFNSAPSGWMCGVWIALEDIDLDNGPLVYYPGSQKMPEYNMDHVGVPVIVNSRDTYLAYENFIEGLIEREKLRPSYAAIRKGQAFIWSANLLHGGSPRRDPNRSRHSQVTHYFFTGCRYYTPLHSQGSRVYWRDPEWIS